MRYELVDPDNKSTNAISTALRATAAFRTQRGVKQSRARCSSIGFLRNRNLLIPASPLPMPNFPSKALSNQAPLTLPAADEAARPFPPEKPS